MTTPNQLATLPATGLINTLDDMERVAKMISGNGMFGITSPGQAIGLFLLCQAEGLNPIAALRRYHIVEGRPSMRADAMQGEFESRGGGIFWHIRSDKMVVATFYADKKTMTDPKAIERARLRAAAMLDGDDKTVMEHTYPGEDTIVRTIQDAIDKGLATTYEKIDGKMTKNPDGTFKKALKTNWAQSTRQMLTARCITEGVRLMNPGLIAGIVSEDEARDIADQTRETYAAIAQDQDANDRNAMEQILAEHELAADRAKSDGERKHYQGLAAEMRCRISDLDVKPATAAEPDTEPVRTIEAKAEIIPPEKAPELKAAKPKPEAPPPAAPEDWRTVDFTHKNLKTSNPLYGKTVGEIFAEGSTEFATKMLALLRKNFITGMDAAVLAHEEDETGKIQLPHPEDMRIWEALNQAERHLAQRLLDAAAK